MTRPLALTSLLLSAGLINATAQPAEFACADRATGFNEIGLISLDKISGSPQEVERLIAFRAGEQGASYYRIIKMTESVSNHCWHAQAIIYA